MYTYLYEYLIKSFCSYTYQCHGLICALPILSAGVNDIGRLFKCFSPPNFLPFCSIICFICSLFQRSSLDGHAYCSPYLTDFLFQFICNRLVSFYSSRSEVSLSSWTSRRRHHSDKVQHAHLDLQHPPSSVSLSSSSTRVLLQMQHYEAIITVSFTRKVLGKDFQRHLK